MPIQQFRLPDLGEGLTEGELLRWTVAVGDTVAVNDTLAEVETVKAAVELPSPWAGVVSALHANEGETVNVGAPLISIDVGGADGAGASGQRTEQPTESAVDGGQDQSGMVPNLVGYGPREQTRLRRHRRAEASRAATQTSFNLPPPTGPNPAPSPAVLDDQEPPRTSPRRALAKPPVRKLAKSLGLDLATVTPSGPGGTITRDDVAAAHQAGTQPSTLDPAGPARESRVPVRGVRRRMAEAMVGSAFTAPQVTEFLTCDVTAMMELRERIAARREFAGAKLSPLVLVAKACLLAIGRTPQLNASWDDERGEIVLKHYVNLGIAAATDRGLVVPNIKDAERLSLRELALAIDELTETARAGTTPPSDFLHGTFTITNVGVFGVDSGTPILNPGESGILAFGAVRRQPWVVGSGASERIEPRWVTQLSVCFDHRVVDGQQGSTFLADVASVITDPGMALL